MIHKKSFEKWVTRYIKTHPETRALMWTLEFGDIALDFAYAAYKIGYRRGYS